MDTVRYFKLHNTGALVARMEVEYKAKHTDKEGNVSYDVNWKSWKPSGYHDICASAERTVDLCTDANLPDGSQVKLKAVVVAGKDKTSDDEYIYQQSCPNTAVYEISGTTVINKLKRKSFG